MTFSDSSRSWCAVCDGHQWLSGDYVFGRPSACTCPVGSLDALALHSPECDSVPCPFCQLLGEPVFQEV